MSQLQHVTNSFRAQLRAYEQHAAHSLVQSHLHMLASLQPHFAHLYREIEVQRQHLEEDEQLPMHWLYTNNRLPGVKHLVTSQVNGYGAVTHSTVAQLQHQAVVLGSQAATAQLQALLPAQTHSLLKASHPAKLAEQVTQAHSKLASLVAGFGVEAAKGAGDALTLGVSLGWKIQQIAAQVQQALITSRNRALVLARSQLYQTYRSALMEGYKAANG